LTLSAHKFGGPPGVGALLLKRGTALRPLILGGHQQHGRRPGTESVALAVGMATALEVAVRTLADESARVELLRQHLLERLRTDAAPVFVNGPDEPARRVPHVLNISFPGCVSQELVIALDVAGMACSARRGVRERLPATVAGVAAMGYADERVRSALRLSFGPDTTMDDIDAAAERIVATLRKLRATHFASSGPPRTR